MTARVILGDCRELLPIPCDIIITDPPYGVDKHGNMLGHMSPGDFRLGPMPTGKGTNSRGYADHDPAKYRELMAPALDGMLHSVPKGGLALIYVGTRTIGEMLEHARHAGWEHLDVRVQEKAFSPARSKTMFAQNMELAILLRRPGGGAGRHWNPQLNKTNLVRRATRRSGGEVNHLTPKSVEWMQRDLNDLTLWGDVVLDPFAGSFTTAVACETMGRDSIGIDDKPEHVAEGRRRLGLALTITSSLPAGYTARLDNADGNR